MTDRLPSDHQSVTTHRASLARSGGTRRPCLRLPDAVAADVTEGDVIRLVLDGTTYHALVSADSRGALVRGAYDNARLARTGGEGTNRLVEWCEETGRGPDDAVELDEIDAGYLYGLRVPGKRTVYAVTRRPDSSLSSIAESLRDDDA